MLGLKIPIETDIHEELINTLTDSHAGIVVESSFRDVTALLNHEVYYLVSVTCLFVLNIEREDMSRPVSSSILTYLNIRQR